MKKIFLIAIVILTLSSCGNILEVVLEKLDICTECGISLESCESYDIPCCLKCTHED